MRRSAPSRRRWTSSWTTVHLHEKHLHHLEEKLDQTNKLLADLLDANVWFSSKVTDAIEKIFESVVWHHGKRHQIKSNHGSSDESETIEVAIKTMDWAGEIMDLFHYENKDAIHQAVQGLRNRYNGEFDATVLLDQLDQLDQRDQHKTTDTHWIFTSPAAMMGTAI